MLDLLLPTALALVSIPACWLTCFEDGSPTTSGWIMILSAALLAGAISWNGRAKDRREKDRLSYFQHSFDQQTGVAEGLRSQNLDFRRQLGRIESIAGDIQVLVGSTLQQDFSRRFAAGNRIPSIYRLVRTPACNGSRPEKAREE